MHRPTLQVVLVLGGLRSGSTLLGGILGAVPAMVTVGEARNVWRAYARNERCSCGASADHCPLWGPVGVELGYLGRDGAAPRVERLRATAEATLRLPRLLRTGRQLSADEMTLGSELARLYAAAAAHSGARTVVDTGKTPNLARVLAGAGVAVKVIHLVRDPRGVAVSERRAKRTPDGDSLVAPPQRTLPRSAVHWAATNSLVERELRTVAVPSVRLRYEDLMADPVGALDRVAGALGLEPALWPIELADESEPTVSFTQAHQLCGNPDRFKQGNVALRPDERWQSALAAAPRFGMELGLRPWMLRYGYAASRRPY